LPNTNRRSHSRCNSPCPNHTTERCGGQTLGSGAIGPQDSSLVTVFGQDTRPSVSWIPISTLLLLCSLPCSVLCGTVFFRSTFPGQVISGFWKKKKTHRVIVMVSFKVTTHCALWPEQAAAKQDRNNFRQVNASFLRCRELILY